MGGFFTRFNVWRSIAAVVGAGLLTAGIAAVAYVDWSPTPTPPPELVRPVKAAVAVPASAVPERRFPGQVIPGRTVDLAFQVGGQLEEADLTLGKEVAEGAVLARLDPTRFDQQIAVLEPASRQAKTLLDRTGDLQSRGSASALELSTAQTNYDTALAQLAIARQAKTDAVLRAPFSALIVQRFVENFQNVQAAEPIVRLQDISTVDIEVSLPESVVARHPPNAPIRVVAEFPVRPGPTYPARVKEASAEADPRTGTYRVVFTMPKPEGLTLLPGMAATIIAPGHEGAAKDGVAVPVEAVFVDPDGQLCLWHAIEGQSGDSHVRKIRIERTRASDGRVVIGTGVEVGWQVVTAGVHFLREGQRVRIMETPR